MTDSQKWLWLSGVFALGWLLYLLSPVLTPFLIAALLAYLGDPIVDRLETLRCSRTTAIITVFAVMMFAFLSLALVLLPIVQSQAVTLMAYIPVAFEWLQQHVAPWIMALPGMEASNLDAAAVKQAIADHWQGISQVLTGILSTVGQSGQVLLSWLFYALLVPVVTFYLLRDWDILITYVHDLLPRRHELRITRLARECDEVLAQFLRGQLLVILVLVALYTIGLWAIGLELAFVIGLLAGLMSFVPYLGVIVGMITASLAALVQFQDLIHVIYSLIVFGIGQLLEGMVLSPRLIGERIGLHPVAVIF
ncbi:MAG TPA: AI-2E family transporter, partial [Gammaproteobacteria bacterium]|nr:AI-2E family transporter [Gammaproteobacteria bacterium]